VGRWKNYSVCLFDEPITGVVSGSPSQSIFPENNATTPTSLSNGHARLEWQTDGSLRSLMHGRSFHNEWRGCGIVRNGERTAIHVEEPFHKQSLEHRWNCPSGAHAILAWELLPGGWSCTHHRQGSTAESIQIAIPQSLPLKQYQVDGHAPLELGWPSTKVKSLFARDALGRCGWGCQILHDDGSYDFIERQDNYLSLEQGQTLLWQNWPETITNPLLFTPAVSTQSQTTQPPPSGRWTLPEGVAVHPWQRDGSAWSANITELIGRQTSVQFFGDDHKEKVSLKPLGNAYLTVQGDD
jgi:hypothetical protein